LGFVSAQLQGWWNLRLRQSLAQGQKSSPPSATSLLSMLQHSETAAYFKPLHRLLDIIKAIQTQN